MLPRPVQSLLRLLRAFRRDERASVTAEFVIVMPLLIWTLLATFSYWDAYRAMNRVQKAAFIITDNLSRTGGDTSQAYLNGLRSMVDYLIDDEMAPRVRFTSVEWRQATNAHVVTWSCAFGTGMTKHTTASFAPSAPDLPEMGDLETLIVVEVYVDYVRPMDVDAFFDLPIGVNNMTFEEWNFVKPRFINKVDWTGPACA
jgi:Flp pilus assembly protein TadG